TGVERTHRQLRAGLTDRLGRDDADGLADVDELAGGQRAAVAARAGADAGLARQDRADLELGDARLEQTVEQDVADVVARAADDLALHLDVGRERPRVHGRLDLVVAAQRPVGRGHADRHGQAAL